MPGKRCPALAVALLLLLALASGLAAGAAQASERVVEMPNLRGKQLKEARRILQYEGFDTINIFGVDTDKRGLDGVVQSQLPPPGALVPTGAKIKLSVYEYSP